MPDNGGRLGGDATWAWLFLAAALVAFALYVAAVWLVRRGCGGHLRVVLALAVAIQLTPLAAPLLLSTDAWTYWALARIAAVRGGNPYVDTPADFPQDVAFPYVGEAWRESTSVYGPAFTLPSELVAHAAGSSPDAAAWAFKALAAVSLLVLTGLAVQLAWRKSLAGVLVGWNPLLAIHFAGGGHNDAPMIALAAAAVLLALRGRGAAAGAAWAAAVLVKWVAVVFLPLRALAVPTRELRAELVGLVLAGAGLAGLATWRYGLEWLNAFGPLARNANEETSYALPARLEQLGVPETASIVCFGLLFAAGYVWLLGQARRGRARLGLAACLVLVSTPYLAAWYTVWAVPLAAAEDDEPAQWLSVALCAYLLPQTVPV